MSKIKRERVQEGVYRFNVYAETPVATFEVFGAETEIPGAKPGKGGKKKMRHGWSFRTGKYEQSGFKTMQAAIDAARKYITDGEPVPADPVVPTDPVVPADPTDPKKPPKEK